MFLRKLLILLLLILLSSCTTEKTAGPDVSAPAGSSAAAPTQYSLVIGPEDADSRTVFELKQEGAADAQITWLVNSLPVTSRNIYRFSSSNLKRGDAVQAMANIKGTEVMSNIIVIRNSPPVMSSALISPTKQGDTMEIEVTGRDIDGDEVTFLYEWTRNGEPAGNGKVLEGHSRKGDKVVVKITPYDGQLYGTPNVLTTELFNLPPVIGEGKMTGFDGNTVTYQVVASDPDNDPLTYSLKSELPGMTIIPDSGLIRWKIPQDFAGTADFTVMVKDGQGGETSQMVRVNVPGQ